MKREYLPLEALPAWVRLNGITLDSISFRRFKSESDGADKGAAVVASAEKSSNEAGDSDGALTLIRVPWDMILSLDGVGNYAKSDRHLREALEAVNDFGKTARGAILIFLLIQLTSSSPDFAEKKRQKIGVSNPWTEYTKFLPSSIPLPSTYTDEEKDLLRGTSLRTAVEAKNAALEREFDHLRQCTEGIPWCQDYWWDEETGKLTIDDWKYIDTVYRSRMVDLPGSGHSLVPCIDMVNHASSERVNALYDRDEGGDVVLRLRLGKELRVGEEVTISYGDEKAAAEMVFSYGFLESSTRSARQIFLDLDISNDDPLKLAKKAFCKEVAGVRLSVDSSDPEHTQWDSPFIWWACVNEEDGLDFNVLQTTDGGKELRAIWKGEDFGDPENFRDKLAADPLWDVFQLRAVVILLGRLEAQLSILQQTEEIISDVRKDENLLNTIFRPDIFGTVSRMRKLEADLLSKGIDDLVQSKNTLLTSETVSKYLSRQSEEAEDFS